MKDFFERLAYCVCRITSEKDGFNYVATGFLYKHNWSTSDKKVEVNFLVVNAHTLKGVDYIDIHFTTKANNEIIDTKTIPIRIETDNRFWLYHQDENVDLAAIPIEHYIKGTNVHGTTLGQAEIITKDDYKDLYLVEDILVVGYPNGLYDEHNNKPIYKMGSIATTGLSYKTIC